jgi:Tfp pilus assembly protein PilO
MFWLWFIIAAICFSVSLYVIGRSDEDDVGGLAGGALVISALWPVVLILIIVVLILIIAIGPFYWFYWLGEKHKKKQEEKSKSNK